MRFDYQTLPARVVFGRGTAREALPEEVLRLGAPRVLLVRARGRASTELAGTLSDPFGGAVVASLTLPDDQPRATAVAAHHGPDVVLVVGDEPTTAAAVELAEELGLPLLVVPTGYQAAVSRALWEGRPGAPVARGQTPPPRTVVLDPDVTDRMPRSEAVGGALAAVAQAVEAQWAPGSGPVTAVLAAEGLAALAGGLRALGGNGSQPSLAAAQAPDAALTDPVGTWAGTPTVAGERLLFGAYLAGSVSATTAPGLHQRMSRALAAAMDLPAGAVRAVLLPHVLRLNAAAVPEAAARIARALDAPEAVRGLRGLLTEAGAPHDLARLGMRPRQLEEAVERVAAAVLPVQNPRPVGRAELHAVLEAALNDRRR